MASASFSCSCGAGSGVGGTTFYLELDDTRGHYFSAVFDEIVDSGVNDNKLVPAGRVVGRERFRGHHYALPP